MVRPHIEAAPSGSGEELDMRAIRSSASSPNSLNLPRSSFDSLHLPHRGPALKHPFRTRVYRSIPCGTARDSFHCIHRLRDPAGPCGHRCFVPHASCRVQRPGRNNEPGRYLDPAAVKAQDLNGNIQGDDGGASAGQPAAILGSDRAEGTAGAPTCGCPVAE